MDMDFGYDGGTSGGNATPPADAAATAPVEQVTNLDTGKVEAVGNDGSVSDLTGGGTAPENKGDASKLDEYGNPIEEKKDDKDFKSYEEGTVIELGDDKYTIDANGNAVDKDGNVFKEAKDVNAWLAENDVVEENTKGDKTLSVDIIKDALGVEIVGENDEPIEFDNTPEGLVSYVQAVIDNTKNEVAEATIERLYAKYPIVENVLNYYVANGHSLEGFNEVPDRTNIVFKADDEAQHEEIIKMAWKEENRKGDVNSYIQYLKANNLLSPTAKEELDGIQAKDLERQELIAERAEAAEAAEIKEQQDYWNNVKKSIDTRSIAGYKIPDVIIRSKDGKKISSTPDEFFNYLYQVDKEGMSAYERDLANKDATKKLNDELLAAYIEYSGGDYSSLVKMAIAEQEVKRVKLVSKQTTKKTKIMPPVTNKPKEIDLGY